MSRSDIGKVVFAAFAVMLMLCVPIAACISSADGQSPTNNIGKIEVKTSDELRQALCYPDVYKRITVVESIEADLREKDSLGDYIPYGGLHVCSGVTLEVPSEVILTLKEGTLYVDYGGELLVHGDVSKGEDGAGMVEVFGDSLVNRGTVTMGTLGAMVVGFTVPGDLSPLVPGTVVNYGKIDVMAGGSFILLDTIFNYGSFVTAPAVTLQGQTLNPIVLFGMEFDTETEAGIWYATTHLYGDTGATYTFNYPPTVFRATSPFTGDTTQKGTYSYQSENNWNICTEWDGKKALDYEHDNVVVGDVQLKDDFTVNKTLIVVGNLNIKEGVKLTVTESNFGSLYCSGKVSVNGTLETDGTCHGMEYSVFDTGTLYANGEPYIGCKTSAKAYYMVDTDSVARAEFGIGYEEYTGTATADVVRVTMGTVVLKRDVSYGEDSLIYVSGGATLGVGADLETKGVLINRGTVDIAYEKSLVVTGDRSAVWGDVYCSEDSKIVTAGDYLQKYGNMDNIRFEVRYGGSVTVPGDPECEFHVGTYDSKDNDLASYVTLTSKDAVVVFEGDMHMYVDGTKDYEYTYKVTAGDAEIGNHNADLEGARIYVAPEASLEFTGAAFDNRGAIVNDGRVKSSDLTLTNYGTYIGDTPSKFKNKMFQGTVVDDTAYIEVASGLDRAAMAMDVSMCPGVRSVVIEEGGAKELKAASAALELTMGENLSMTLSEDFIALTDRNGKDVFRDGSSWEIAAFLEPDTEVSDHWYYIYMKSGDDYVTDFHGTDLGIHLDVDDGSSLHMNVYYLDEDNIGTLVMDTGPATLGYSLWGQVNFTVNHLSCFVATSDPDFSDGSGKGGCTVALPSGEGYSAYDLADGRVATGGHTYFTLVEDGKTIESVSSDKAILFRTGTVCTVYDIEGNVTIDVAVEGQSSGPDVTVYLYIGLAAAVLLLLAAVIYVMKKKGES